MKCLELSTGWWYIGAVGWKRPFFLLGQLARLRHFWTGKNFQVLIWLVVLNMFWLVVWNIFYFPIYWEFHHPNWLIFFRGVAQPPTRCCFFIYWECHHPNWRTHIFETGWNHPSWFRYVISISGTKVWPAFASDSIVPHRCYICYYWSDFDGIPIIISCDLSKKMFLPGIRWWYRSSAICFFLGLPELFPRNRHLLIDETYFHTSGWFQDTCPIFRPISSIFQYMLCRYIYIYMTMYVWWFWWMNPHVGCWKCHLHFRKPNKLRNRCARHWSHQTHFFLFRPHIWIHTNVGKAINHPPNHISFFQPFPNGWFMALF